MTDDFTDLAVWGPTTITSTAEIIVAGSWDVGGPRKMKFALTSTGAVTTGGGTLFIDYFKPKSV